MPRTTWSLQPAILDHRATLQWIAHGSCDPLIALSIVHTLNTVNTLDEELRLADRTDADRYFMSTELRRPKDDLDKAAAGLLDGLVDRLAVLDPPACVRWIGELLSGASYMLHRGGDQDDTAPNLAAGKSMHGIVRTPRFAILVPPTFLPNSSPDYAIPPEYAGPGIWLR